MVDITQIDHIEEGLALLPSQWDNKPILRGVLESWLTPLNTTEQCAIDVRDGFNICTAIGAQLDIIGEYFDESRLGRSDTEYRAAILSRISAANGSGTPDQLIDLFGTITASSSVTFYEHYPLSVALLSVGGADSDLTAPFNMLEAAAASIEFVGLMFDPAGFDWIGQDATLQFGDANLIDNASNQIIDDNLNDIVATILLDSIDDGNLRGSFVDETVDGDQVSGYGENYGGVYGGSAAEYSWLAETTMTDNSLITSGGNGFVLWAGGVGGNGIAILDPLTQSTNKLEPIQQYKNSGINNEQPIPRQFFNWAMALIDDWLSLVSDRSLVDAIRMTVDVTQTASDYDTRFGGTWAYVGSDTFGGITTYIFKRTA
ncbi:MAG: DUF2612 domain-containing protein [Alphaproteobacteria bacterium]|nr:DUF2612 domain-containing protein [Alphaproteobacteria bacterium]